MAKRKSTAVDTSSSPTKRINGTSTSMKQEKRPASSDSDSDDGEEPTELHAEAEDTLADVGHYLYEPDEMRAMCESFSEFIKSKRSTSVANIEKSVADWALTLPDSQIDVSMFIADFKKYLKTSTRLKNFQAHDAVNTILTHLSSDRSLPDFKTFPAKPLQKIQLYCKKKNISARIVDIKNAYDQIRAEDSTFLAELDEEMRNSSVDYATALEGFLEQHPNMTDEQKRAVNKILKRIRQRVAPPTPKTPRTQKQKGAKKKQEPETAFTLFCRTKADKYTDLSEEDREKKLRKKFSKLTAPQLDILEGLALNL